MTYTLLADNTAIRCNVCGRTSWNINDVRHLYCGFCKAFHQRGEQAQ
jgi:ribosomal protein L37E